MFHVRGEFRIFFRRVAPNFVTFSSLYFVLAELILSNLCNKYDSGGPGGMLPRKIFENLITAMAIVVLFQHFSGKVRSYFWPLTLSAAPNRPMMHSVSIMRA